MAHKNILISYRTAAAFALGVTAMLIVLLATNAAGASLFAPRLEAASPPQVVNYQGIVDVEGAPYNGTGFFKFAIVDTASGDGSANYWANDGTANGEPGQTVPLTVQDGFFDVLLGDTAASGMTVALAEPVFANSETYLRVWFSEDLGGPFDALEPNQRIGSVPYALRASYAETGSAMVPSGAVMFFNASNCPSGWSELTAARGRAVVGLPGSGTLAGTQGTALTNLENRAHTHDVNPPSVTSGSGGSHSHTTGEPTQKGAVALSAGGIFIDYGEANHLHNISTASSHTHSVNLPATESTTASTSNVMPYIQLLACEKD